MAQFKILNYTGLANLVSDIIAWVTARIPTKTSEITNDSGFLTEHQDLSLYPFKMYSTGTGGIFKYFNLADEDYVEAGFGGFTTTGIYRVRTSSAVLDAPTTSTVDGNLIVINSGPASGVSSNRRCKQIFINNSRYGGIYYRTGSYTSSSATWTWYPWVQDVDTTSTQDISGIKTFTSHLRFSSANTRGTAPSSREERDLIDYKDSAENRIFLMDTIYYTDKSSTTSLLAYNTTAATGSNIGGITIGCDASGKAYTTAITPDASDDSTKIATTAWVNAKGYLTSHQSLSDYATKTYVDTSVSNLVNSAPAALDTLNELATALGNDANFSTTVTTLIGTKADDSSVVHTSGNETIAGTKTFSSTIAGSINGNAATATEFSSNATVALTGDATGTSAGSKKGWSVPVTLVDSGVTAGSYGPSADVTGNNNATISVPEITVDAKGRITSVVNRTLTCKNNTYNVYNKTLTIQKNGTNVATFTSNSNTNVTANITVPTATSELTNDSGYITSSSNITGTAANVTGTVAIANGGTGATTRLDAVKNLTNENVGTSTQYFLTITSSWGKAGYCSVSNAKSVLGVGKVTQTVTTDSADIYPLILSDAAGATATRTSTVRFHPTTGLKADVGVIYTGNSAVNITKGYTGAAVDQGGICTRLGDGATSVGWMKWTTDASGGRYCYISSRNYIKNGAPAADGSEVGCTLAVGVTDQGKKLITASVDYDTGDNSTKIATTAFVRSAIPYVLSGGALTSAGGISPVNGTIILGLALSTSVTYSTTTGAVLTTPANLYYTITTWNSSNSAFTVTKGDAVNGSGTWKLLGGGPTSPGTSTMYLYGLWIKVA